MTAQPSSRVGTADINGIRFVYEVAGQGYPLVLAHAGIADRRMWDDQWQVFAQHYQVIRYDMRGFGDTPMVPGAFSHRQDLYELLRFFRRRSRLSAGLLAGRNDDLGFCLGTSRHDRGPHPCV